MTHCCQKLAFCDSALIALFLSTSSAWIKSRVSVYLANHKYKQHVRLLADYIRLPVINASFLDAIINFKYLCVIVRFSFVSAVTSCVLEKTSLRGIHCFLMVTLHFYSNQQWIMFKCTIVTNDITLPVYNISGFGKESESAFRNDIWFSKSPE